MKIITPKIGHILNKTNQQQLLVVLKTRLKAQLSEGSVFESQTDHSGLYEN